MENKLSVVLIVYNEEKNIKDCLESVKWADEIIIVDQRSDDNTVGIAKSYTDKIFITAPKLICNPDREFGVSKTSNDWIFLLEADERVDENLRSEICSIINSQESKDVYFVPVKTFFVNKWIKTCGWYPAYIPRLFKKNKMEFPPYIHTHGKILTDKIGFLKNSLLHYSYNSIDDWIDKFKRYSSQIANENFEKGKKINLKNHIVELFLRPLYFFLLKFIILKGYKDGWRGFFISISSALTISFAYFKLIELWMKKNNCYDSKTSSN